jgi:hypothetical protein
VQKIRKKYILIIFALFPISIAEITSIHQIVKDDIHQIVKDEKNTLYFYHVRPRQRDKQNEKELESKRKMIEAGAQQLK